MWIDALFDLDKLFENRREPFVVAALTVNGPMRFSALAFEVSRYARVKVPDSTITRILARLRRHRLVETVYESDHLAYQLTAEGQKVGEMIEVITDAMLQRRTDRSAASPDASFEAA